MSNEIIEAIITGLVIGIGMVVYRVYQYQTKNDDTLLPNTPDQPTGNAMETVKDSHATSVELLHEQIDHMQQHVKELEQQHTDKDTVIDRLQELLLAQRIVTNDDGFVISNRAEVTEE
jgi:TolA-binding protein